MTRVIAGTAGGRTLRTPPGSGTRPTSDRVREAVFSALDARDAVRGARVLAGNARELKLPGTRVVRSTVAAHLFPDPAPDEPSDLVFVDPPYDLDDTALVQVLARLRAGWLAPHGLLVVERSTRSPEPTWPDGIALATKPKKYGETTIWYATRD